MADSFEKDLATVTFAYHSVPNLKPSYKPSTKAFDNMQLSKSRSHASLGGFVHNPCRRGLAGPQFELLFRLSHQHRQTAKCLASNLTRLAQKSGLSWIVN